MRLLLFLLLLFSPKNYDVIEILDLQPEYIVADIGAGGGHWSQRIASKVKTVYALEVSQLKVDRIDSLGVENIQATLCPYDSTGLSEDSCDLVFMSKVYHVLDDRINYLRHLTTVSKRLAIIEAYPRGRCTYPPSRLKQEAETAGWVLKKYVGLGDHYIMTFEREE